MATKVFQTANILKSELLVSYFVTETKIQETVLVNTIIINRINIDFYDSEGKLLKLIACFMNIRICDI